MLLGWATARNVRFNRQTIPLSGAQRKKSLAGRGSPQVRRPWIGGVAASFPGARQSRHRNGVYSRSLRDTDDSTACTGVKSRFQPRSGFPRRDWRGPDLACIPGPPPPSNGSQDGWCTATEFRLPAGNQPEPSLARKNCLTSFRGYRVFSGLRRANCLFRLRTVLQKAPCFAAKSVSCSFDWASRIGGNRETTNR